MNYTNRYYPQLERTLNKSIYYCYKGGDPIVKSLEECIAKWRNGEEIYEKIGQVFLPPQSLCPELSGNNFRDIEIFEAKDITQGEILGRGSFGAVYMAYINRKVYAAKEYRLANETIVMSAKNELESLKRLTGHPNVIQLEGYLSGPERIVLIVEYLGRDRDLRRICQKMHKKSTWFNKQAAFDIASGITSGLEFIHAQHIAHLDIKVTDKKMFH